MCGRLFGAALLLAVVAAWNPSAQAQTWLSAISSSTTASGASITWSTAVPSDSQVEYGATAAYGSFTSVSASKVTAHTVSLSGLTAGTSYHFRVRSGDASGVLVMGPDNTFATAAALSISVSPQAASIAASATQQFTATVSNNANKTVSWTATTGTVSASGLFTAPAVSAATTVTITAVSQADSTKSATSTITVNPAAPIVVTISPASGALAPGGQQQFTATVSNAPGTLVAWSASAGSITSSGLYTAPSVSSTSSAMVTAKSSSDPTKFAVATLVIGTAQASGAMLLGNAAVETAVNLLPAGLAEGYQMTASTTGTLNTLNVYVDQATTATNLLVGLYSDNNGHPGTLLTHGNSTNFQKSAWTPISVPPISVTAGNKYWFSLLASGGAVKFRQRQGSGGWIDELNSVTGLTSLPATWTSGTVYAGGAWTSAYGSGPTNQPVIVAGTTMLGDLTIESAANLLPAGLAEGYQMTASTTGTLNTLSVYVDQDTTATNLLVGLYSDSNGHPGTLLTQGNSTSFQKNAWTTIAVAPVAVTAGSKYWFSLLASGGSVKFRQKQGSGGWIDELNNLTGLTSLPATWSSGTVYAGGAWTSAYGSGMESENAGPPPATTPVLEVSPASLNFSAQVGASNVSPASISVTNIGAGTIAFTGTSDQPWLTLSRSSGTAPSSVAVSPSTTGLKAGTFTGHVALTGGGSTRTVTVTLTVTAVPVQHTVALSWKTSTNAHVVSYSMYRSNLSGSSYGLLASALGAVSYRDQSVQPGTAYYYVVTAVDDQGRESVYSGEIKAVIP